jgi:hypothetical protein
MLKSIVFKIIMGNGRTAFNGAVLESPRDDKFYIFIDTSIKRYNTYMNLFLRIFDGKYSMEYVSVNELKRTHKPKLKVDKIKYPNIFNNFLDYKERFATFNIDYKEFEVSLSSMDSFLSFFNCSNYISLETETGNLLTDNLKLQKEFTQINMSLKDYLIGIFNNGYSKAILTVENMQDFDKINFSALSINDMNLLSNLSSFLQSILLSQYKNNKVFYGIENKCLQVTAYIPKNELLESNSQVFGETLENIKTNNFNISDEEGFNSAKVVNDIFKISSSLDYLQFSFQDNLLNGNTIKDNKLFIKDFDKNKLDKSIKKFQKEFKGQLEELESTFIIDGIDGIYNPKRTIYFLLDCNDDNKKYRFVVKSSDNGMRNKLLNIQKNGNNINARIKYKKHSRYRDIQSIAIV